MIINSVNELLEKPFKHFSKEEQLEIARQGRFTDLTHLIQNDKGKYRMFAINWYKRVKWLTGNTVNSKLYCWSCLLFPMGSSKIWNTTGFDDLKNLSQSIKKHEETKEHIYSTVKLKLLLKETRIQCETQEDTQNNVRIKRNREYLERVIDVASSLAHFEVPFRKADEAGDSGFYKYFFNMFKKYDDIVRTQLEEDSPFKGLTKIFQIDLIESIAQAVKQKIVDEVEQANFFALQMDEVSCSKISKQVSVSIRYIREARPVERFIGLYELGPNNKSEDFIAMLEKELECFNYMEKLIAQSYDGGVVKYTELYNLQQAVKKLQTSQTKCQLVHSYTHDISGILSQSLRSIQECKLFFSMIKLFSSFFKHIALIDVLPDVPPTWTDSVFCCITTIRKNHISLIQVLEFINTADEYANSSDIISQAVNLINHLKSFKFMLFVHMFQSFFSFVEETFDDMRKNAHNAAFCRKRINSLIDALKVLKSETSFKSLLSSVPSTTGQQVIVTGMLDLQAQILDHIIYEIDGRFLDIELGECWGLVSLDNIPKEPKFKKVPDAAQLTSLKENYPDYFDLVKLKSELDLVYGDSSIVGIGEEITKVSHMLKFMYDHEINTCLPELYKLLELMVTIPFLSDPLEDMECVLNRIKNYAKSEKNDEPRSALAFLIIEKELFCKMEKSPQWYERVIEFLATKPSASHVELTYKQPVPKAPVAEKCEIQEPELSIKSDPDMTIPMNVLL